MVWNISYLLKCKNYKKKSSVFFFQLEIMQNLLWINRWKAPLTGRLKRVTARKVCPGEKECCKATAESCYISQLVLSLIAAEGVQHCT